MAKIIKSIGHDEQQIIRDILHLHCNGHQIECEPTYSTGNFYKHGLAEPIYKFDLFPQTPDTVKANANDLPLDDESINVLMFDPPFLMNGESKKDPAKKTGLMGKRFTSFANWIELTAMYRSCTQEFYRVLKPGGTLIFKCQDSVAGGRNHFTHIWVMNQAVQIGFYPKDLFVLLAKARMLDGRAQQHARKFHCYFWVFEKRPCKVNYAQFCQSL